MNSSSHDFTDYERKLFNLMSPAEIAICIGQDPDFVLPPFVRCWRQKMQEAFEMIHADAAMASPAWRVDRTAYQQTTNITSTETAAA